MMSTIQSKKLSGTKVCEIEKKITDHDLSNKYITTKESNKFSN